MEEQKFNKEKLEDKYNTDRLEEKKQLIDVHKNPIINPREITFSDDAFVKMISEIQQKEPEAAEVLYQVILHIWKTYDDKYQQNGVTKIIDTKALLLGENGKWANLHNASKYLQRYMSSGKSKSYNIEDLYKSAHYIFFEIQRRKKEE